METPPPQPADDDSEPEIDSDQVLADNELQEDEAAEALRRASETDQADATEELRSIYEGAEGEGEGSPQDGTPDGQSGYQAPPDRI